MFLCGWSLCRSFGISVPYRQGNHGGKSMIRRFGDAADKSRAYTRRPGAYAVLLRGKSALITYQDCTFPEYQLPGGGIDPGETPVQALHREVYEETGWAISNPVRLGVYRRFAYMPEYDLYAEKLCHIYLARPVRARSAPTEPDHLPIWTDPASAIRLLSGSGDRHFMRIATGIPADRGNR